LVERSRSGPLTSPADTGTVERPCPYRSDLRSDLEVKLPIGPLRRSVAPAILDD
jgi:hypothetical protein